MTKFNVNNHGSMFSSLSNSDDFRQLLASLAEEKIKTNERMKELVESLEKDKIRQSEAARKKVMKLLEEEKINRAEARKKILESLGPELLINTENFTANALARDYYNRYKR